MTEDEKTIYAIIREECGDWEITGYTEKELDAMQICAQHNMEGEEKGEHSICWCYREANPAVQKTEVELKFVHEFRFMDSKTGYKACGYDLYYFSNHSKYAAKEVSVRKFPSGIIEVCVPSDETNAENAKKIAQDALYKYMSEKQGI